MNYLPLFGSVLIIHLMAVMSPGPDFIMALRNSLTYSRKTGIYTAIGFGFGIGVHVLYCVFGLALIISTSTIAFNIIKYLGVAYLGYIWCNVNCFKKYSH
jgi:threonine/homoserine/homoserine lactone efflux protein